MSQGRVVWHVAWASTVVVALLLNVIQPIDPSYPIWAAGLIAYPVASAVLLIHRPGNPVGLVMAATSWAAAVIFIGGWAMLRSPEATWSLYIEVAGSPAVVTLFWSAISLLYVFPDGLPHGKGVRWSFALSTGLVGVLALVGVFVPGPMATTGRLNPIGGPAWLGALFDVGVLVLLPFVGVGVANVVGRYRKSVGALHAQMKWFVAGAAAVVMLVLVIGLVPELEPPYELMLAPVVVLGFWGLPIAVLLAVLRYRLYEIDRIVSRSLSYSVVAALIVGLYWSVVVSLQTLLPISSNLAVAGSTLVVAASFRPLLRAVQHRVDRRFNRTRFDADVELHRLTLRIGDVTDPADIGRELVDAVARTLAPDTAGLWLRNK